MVALPTMVCANICQRYRGGANGGGCAGIPTAMVVMLAVPAISLLAVVKMLVKAHPFFGMTSMAHGCHVLPEGDVGHLQCGPCILGGGGVVWLLQLGASALVASVRASSSFSFILFSCSLFKKAKKKQS
jgi:hypothetical protein